MKFFCKIMKQDPDSREGVITSVSGLGIVVNLLIAAVKVILGALASSIAIVSEGVNNAADALTSVLTLIGTKLAGRHPDEKHPFGYGRVEYLTSLVVSVLITVTGAEMLISSVKLIFNPEEMSVSVLSVIIVAASAVVKFLLGGYTVKKGKDVDSGALVAVGSECKSDSYASIITIASTVIFLVFGLSLDAYAGIITSALIIKAGVEVLVDTVGELIGRPGEKELADKLYREIRGTDGIINAVDMMLHNYGPDAWSGSVNIELDHKLTIGEAYQFIHALQLKIMHEYNVVMVFGMYAVDSDTEAARALRTDIASYIRAHDHLLSYHAVYLEPETDRIYCDIIVDYSLPDWQAAREEFLAYMADRYPGREVILTLETEFV